MGENRDEQNMSIVLEKLTVGCVCWGAGGAGTVKSKVQSADNTGIRSAITGLYTLTWEHTGLHTGLLQGIDEETDQTSLREQNSPLRDESLLHNN